ncbi:thioredoxin family protein [Nitriliruptoraceae bacterium ZYF776]|nr:thioredoxin family protein [Profundirhabdus halotolerans]
MSGLCEINMSFDECLDEAKARLIMVAFVKFNDEDFESLMSTLQEISKDFKKLIILAVDATRNLQLARDLNVNACPTFLFFRKRTLLGRRITTKPTKLKKDVEKYSKTFVACTQELE